MSLSRLVLFVFTSVALLSGCASNKMKERKEQRDKLVQNSKMWCEFINGEVFPDIDIALNIEMVKRCDPDKPFSMSQYKTPSENPGIIYCCSTLTREPASDKARKIQKATPKKQEPADEIIE